jgi:hypothetical protein
MVSSMANAFVLHTDQTARIAVSSAVVRVQTTVQVLHTERVQKKRKAGESNQINPSSSSAKLLAAKMSPHWHPLLSLSLRLRAQPCSHQPVNPGSLQLYPCLCLHMLLLFSEEQKTGRQIHSSFCILHITFHLTSCTFKAARCGRKHM